MTRDDPRAPRPTLSVTVDGHPPLPNALRRLHWSRRAESNRVWRTSARFVVKDAMNSGLLATPFDRATLHIVWLHRLRSPDLDAVTAAMKPVIDGMVDAGLLVDDDSRHLVSVTASLEKSDRDAVRLEVTPA